MRTLSKKDIASFCDIIQNEPDQRIKNKLSAWADQYCGNGDANVDFGLLSGIASTSIVKSEIEQWINNLIGTPSITIPEPVTETVVETPNTVVIDAPIEPVVEVPQPKEPAKEETLHEALPPIVHQETPKKVVKKKAEPKAKKSGGHL